MREKPHTDTREKRPDWRRGSTTAGYRRLLTRATGRPLAVLTFLMQTALTAILALLCFAGANAMALDSGSIQGHATDASGTPVYGAIVIVEDGHGGRHTTVTDAEGAFQLSSLPDGNYTVKVSASGFTEWTASNVPASVPPDSKPLAALLELAPQVTAITVGLPPEEVATEQVHQELQQRVLGGVFPNYYVSFEPNPAPLSPKQKLHLGWKLLLDPSTFAAAGVTAGIQQGRNSYYQWGQGSEGFAKRFGAAYGTAAQNLLITSVVADSVFHQDPRYFYSGHGTKSQRALYAVKSAFLARGDNGKWQPPYAGMVGTIASAELSQVYYPGERTQYSLLGRTMMFHFVGSVALNLGQEFFLKRLTNHRPVEEAASKTVLPEGTPVPLLVVDAPPAEEVTAGRVVTFVLAEDLAVSGKVVAKSGEVASGQVGQVNRPVAPGGKIGVTLERVTLRTGNVTVPLRSVQVRGVSGPTQYRLLPESGKIEVTLFVAQDTRFPDNL